MTVGDLISVDLKVFARSMKCHSYLLRKYDNLPLRIDAGLICRKMETSQWLAEHHWTGHVPRYYLRILIDDGRLIDLPCDDHVKGIFMVQEKAMA